MRRAAARRLSSLTSGEPACTTTTIIILMLIIHAVHSLPGAAVPGHLICHSVHAMIERGWALAGA
jgi:hypothetical protein